MTASASRKKSCRPYSSPSYSSIAVSPISAKARGWDCRSAASWPAACAVTSLSRARSAWARLSSSHCRWQRRAVREQWLAPQTGWGAALGASAIVGVCDGDAQRALLGRFVKESVERLLEGDTQTG